MDFDKKHLFNYQLLLKITKGKVQSFSKGFSILQLKIMNTKQVCLKAKEPEFKTRPPSDSEAAIIYKLKGKSSNVGTGQGFK